MAILSYVSVAIHENARTDDEVFGRYLILQHCREKLAPVRDALEPDPRLEVVNG
jgi:hypothetical protein